MKLNIHHVGLAVSQLEQTEAFFRDVLGWSLVKRNEQYPAVFLSNGEIMMTLWQTLPQANAFDRTGNVGLHHLAFSIASEAELQTLFNKVVATEGVVVDFAPEARSAGPGLHFMVFEPSGIRLEFVHIP